MNICLITPAFPLNEDDHHGAFSLDFARALERRDHKVFVCTPDREDVKEDLGLNIHWFRWPGWRQETAGMRFRNPRDIYHFFTLIGRGAASLKALIEQEKIGACLAIWAVPSGIIANRVFKKTKIPYSVWALGPDIWIYSRNPFLRRIVKTVFRNAEVCFANGFNLAKEVENTSGTNCTFLPTARVLPPVQSRTETENTGKTRFLFVGRFDHTSGVELLIDAAGAIEREQRNFTVRICGEGPLGDRLPSRIENMGLSETVQLGGRLGRRAFAAELELSDALIIPSLMESIPVVMTDALQKGIPVLVSNVGDMGYLVRVYDVGLVFEPDNAQSLTDTMIRFVDSKGAHAKRIPELSKEISVERAADIYLESMEETR